MPAPMRPVGLIAQEWRPSTWLSWRLTKRGPPWLWWVQDGAPVSTECLQKRRRFLWLNSMVYGRYNLYRIHGVKLNQLSWLGGTILEVQNRCCWVVQDFLESVSTKNECFFSKRFGFKRFIHRIMVHEKKQITLLDSRWEFLNFVMV